MSTRIQIDNPILQERTGQIVRRVVFDILEDGTMPGKDDLEDLYRKDKQKYFALKSIFRQWVQNGYLPASKLDDYKGCSGLFKFKCKKGYPFRAPCYFRGDTCYIVGVIRKPQGDKAYQKRIELMKRRMELGKGKR